MLIYVNGEEKAIDNPTVGYDDVCRLAGEDPTYTWTITYHTRRKGDEQRSGAIWRGREIQAEQGMRFLIGHTGHG